MLVKIAFDPYHLKHEDEAWPAFNAGGMTLVFWALFKKRFNTSQHFRHFLVRLANHIAKCNDKEDPTTLWTNIDECWELLNFQIGHDKSFKGWLLENWDYFNPAIQRNIVIEYKPKREIWDWMQEKNSTVQIKEEG